MVEQVLEVPRRWADRYPSLALEWVYTDGPRAELDSNAATEGVRIPHQL